MVAPGLWPVAPGPAAPTSEAAGAMLSLVPLVQGRVILAGGRAGADGFLGAREGVGCFRTIPRLLSLQTLPSQRAVTIYE